MKKIFYFLLFLFTYSLQAEVVKEFDADGFVKAERKYIKKVLRSEKHFVGGKKHGIFKTYYPRGELLTESSYKNDLLEGLSNTYFKTVAHEINKIATTYRTHGPRLGIILNDDRNYKDIIKTIRNLKVTHNSIQSRVISTIAVSWGNPSNIIEKSHHALLLATNSLDKYHEFK